MKLYMKRFQIIYEKVKYKLLKFQAVQVKAIIFLTVEHVIRKCFKLKRHTDREGVSTKG